MNHEYIRPVSETRTFSNIFGNIPFCVLSRNKTLPSVKNKVFRLFRSVMAIIGKFVDSVNTGKRLRK